MKRTLVVLLGLMLLTGVAVTAAEAVVPIEIESVNQYFMFNNETGADVSKLTIIFDLAAVTLAEGVDTIALTANDFIAFGGGVPTMIAASTTFVFIDVEVVAGGTLQLIIPAEFEGAKVVSAFWFE